MRKSSKPKRQIKDKFAEERVTRVSTITPKSKFQEGVLHSLRNQKVSAIMGSAGVGKSFLAMSYASDELMQGRVSKLILARPAVEMDEAGRLGFLKGDLYEKYSPYLMPLIEVFWDRYSQAEWFSQLKNQNIELLPLSYIRGRNIKDCITIIDEVQNCTKKVLKSTLTRIGENGQLILLGDSTQSDLPKGRDGITWLDNYCARNSLHDVICISRGSSDDIVRSEFVKRIVKAFESDDLLHID